MLPVLLPCVFSPFLSLVLIIGYFGALLEGSLGGGGHISYRWCVVESRQVKSSLYSNRNGLGSLRQQGTRRPSVWGSVACHLTEWVSVHFHLSCCWLFYGVYLQTACYLAAPSSSAPLFHFDLLFFVCVSPGFFPSSVVSLCVEMSLFCVSVSCSMFF